MRLAGYVTVNLMVINLIIGRMAVERPSNRSRIKVESQL